MRCDARSARLESSRVDSSRALILSPSQLELRYPPANSTAHEAQADIRKVPLRSGIRDHQATEAFPRLPFRHLKKVSFRALLFRSVTGQGYLVMYLR